MKLSTFLGKAKRIIRDEGNWVQREYHAGNGEHCMLGALEAAGMKEEKWDDFDSPTPIMKRAAILLAEIIRSHKQWRQRVSGNRAADCVIPAFNDHGDTEHSEVMKIFTEAQRRAKIQEQENAKAKV